MEPTKAISTAEFVDSAFDSAADREAIKDHLHQRLLTSQLAMLRASKGITQAQLASAMKCGQSRVSKLEAGVDAELTMADLESYAKATDSDVTIVISNRGKNLAEQIKWHTLSIRRLFSRLAKLAHQDHEIARGVAKFHMEAFQNLNAFLSETAKQLPVSEDGSPYIQIAAVDEEEDSSELAKSKKRSSTNPSRQKTPKSKKMTSTERP